MFYQWPRVFSEWFSERAVPKALTVSVVCHLLGFLIVDAAVGVTPLFRGNKLSPLAQIREEAIAREKTAEQAQREEPAMVFVEVDPTQASEPPKDTRLYSTANTQAANPKVSDKDLPQIDGREDSVPKTFDTVKPAEQFPLQPTVATPEPTVAQDEPKPAEQPVTKPVADAPKTQAQAEPKPDAQEIKPIPDGIAIVPERTIPQVEPPTSVAAPRPVPVQKPRPRRLAQVTPERGRIIGEKMKSEGGVSKFQLEPGLDVKDSPFGAYDAAFIAAVQNRWHQLLDQRDFVGNHRGKVILEFRLQPDGRITHMQVAQNGVNETLAWLCQRAVEDPSPYGKLPSDLRRLMQKEYREVRFTFHYR